MSDLTFRRATREDLPAIVAMLAADSMGAGRESPDDLTPYLAAFDRVSADANQHLIVADRGGEVVGTLQLSVIPGISRQGITRTVVEAVRVRADQRGSGLGTALMEHAVAESRRLGASLVQLTSDGSRVDAHRFYERLGFTGSHIGFKLPLT
ncbi:GNAT family N-acetyltransferase [Streptacidiphilus rugosus]|uniref:GNAT family N-acetyltransferase n=1 Tax=Streptacidiphilus rugosus TaxID=405783 RepID=UPI00055F6B34|nr:GNAT family N-acetyltransferase [Streptacidiphilus rugosus]